ncbi:MAG: vanadium-dependent haloperoxidase [bacterium]
MLPKSFFLTVSRVFLRFRRNLAAGLAVSLLLTACGGGGNSANNYTVARLWDEAALDAIRIDTPRPPVHARNLWHLSLAMYDAWAVYDAAAKGYLTTEKVAGLDSAQIAAARSEAISYAAYGVLKNRYALSVNAVVSLSSFDNLMKHLGYDTAVTRLDGNSPAAVGNRVAAAVIAFGNSDGSNQAANYADLTYTPVNAPLIVKFPGNAMSDPNRWQPLVLDVSFTQNGLPVPSGPQKFVGSQWGNVKPFALAQKIDAGPPPMLGASTDAEFKTQMLEVAQKSGLLSPDLNAAIDISPGAYGNNSLGANDGIGRTVNPATGQPYPSQMVKWGDFARVLAEYWADGPNSETPPGHWNVLANQVSDHPLCTHQFQGTGPAVDRLEWDVKLYFALNGAVHDAAVNAWGLKRIYDSVRPISAIRFMATKGQSSDPTASSYDPQGLPLVNGVTELITNGTWPSGRHAGIQCCTNLSGDPSPCVDSQGNPGVQVSCVGEVAVMAWPGQPADRTNQYSGVKWIRAKEWIPYQLSTFVTPAFPGYNSGHSTFSRAAAEVLAAFTGSEFFPGGIAEAVAPKNGFLKFEQGPSQEVRLQWATYFDASDQAGQSRLYGGIHIQADDFTGRVSGSTVGKQVFAKAKTYFEGTATP